MEWRIGRRFDESFDGVRRSLAEAGRNGTGKFGQIMA
jgi:hypothetical protein